MTRLDALTSLRDKVKAGDITRLGVEGRAINALECGDDFKRAVDAGAAYHGSLDAAKALHEAVLPGYGWTAGGGAVRVYKLNGFPCSAHASVTSTPARAWLLAILEALIAQEGAKE